MAMVVVRQSSNYRSSVGEIEDVKEGAVQFTPEGSVPELWSAQSVAVVGASESEGKPGYRVLANLRRFGYQGRIYPVNSRLDSCQGLTCFRSLSDLPERPDVIAIVLAAPLVPAVMQEAADLGIRAVLIISSGFGEAGEEGARLQDQVADIAEVNSMVVCGPNSVGFIRTENNLALTFTEALSRGDMARGNLGFVSQSGAFGTVLYAQARERKLGFNTYLSSGNEASLNFGHYALALLEDPNIAVVGGYVEGLREADSLAKAAERSRELAKPLVILKVGRSQAGGSAAASHTGALVGSEAAYRTAFEKWGIIQVDDEQQLLDGMDALQTQRNAPAGDRVAIVSMSGGAGVLLTDLLEERGLTLATVSEPLENRLRQLLPGFASVANPIDVTGQFVTNPEGIDQVVEEVARDPGIDIVIVYIGLAWSKSEVWQSGLEKAAKAGKPIFVGAPMMEPGSEFASALRESGVSVYRGTRQVVDSIATLVRWSEARKKEQGPYGGTAPSATQSQRHTDGAVSESELKKELAREGFLVPQGRLVTTPTEAAAFAREIQRPTVLKAHGPGLHHKSDVGGVAIGVAVEDVESEYNSVIGRLLERQIDVSGIHIEEMAPPGLELMVGAVSSPPFGLLMAVGVGGVDVELDRQVRYVMPPLGEREAKDVVGTLPVARKLEGYRGDEGFDAEGLYRFLVKFSDFLERNRANLREIDLNPVSVQRGTGGVIVLDAMAVFGT